MPLKRATEQKLESVSIKIVGLACALVLLMGFTALPQDADWRRSRTLPVFLPGALWLRGWLPDWAAAHARFELGTAEPSTDATASRT